MGLCGVEGFSSVITLPTDFCAFASIHSRHKLYCRAMQDDDVEKGVVVEVLDLRGGALFPFSINLHCNGMHTSLANGFNLVPALA